MTKIKECVMVDKEIVGARDFGQGVYMCMCNIQEDPLWSSIFSRCYASFVRLLNSWTTFLLLWKPTPINMCNQRPLLTTRSDNPASIQRRQLHRWMQRQPHSRLQLRRLPHHNVQGLWRKWHCRLGMRHRRQSTWVVVLAAAAAARQGTLRIVVRSLSICNHQRKSTATSDEDHFHHCRSILTPTNLLTSTLVHLFDHPLLHPYHLCQRRSPSKSHIQSLIYLISKLSRTRTSLRTFHTLDYGTSFQHHYHCTTRISWARIVSTLTFHYCYQPYMLDYMPWSLQLWCRLVEADGIQQKQHYPCMIMYTKWYAYPISLISYKATNEDLLLGTMWYSSCPGN